MDPRPGDVLHVGSGASVQFAGKRSVTFRVIKVRDWTTYDGWVWLLGYTLDRTGNAMDRREIFVRPAGLRLIAPAPTPATGRTGQVGRSGTTRKAPAAASPSRRSR
ncbi:hypothetical protein Vlu01_40360 [Micromonospora lutea]|uniref:Uncharacterized protein n=1 Tax=Micromonospora lutea TaxID=419825 RepID=A0ABQ4IZQ7_9ACTN|nr:hypothetical protein [Micromonospora lutea]GIJ23412.1 hypothetical protein Vlu01_40360 [Micromonospora lutea]